MTRRGLLAGAIALLSAADVEAQVPADSVAARALPSLASACPDDGAFVAASSVGPLRTGDSIPSLRRFAMDTMLTFSVADRRWTWPSLWAAVAAGTSGGGAAAGEEAARGTEGARWRACAGAAIHMRDATLHLRGASGRIRFKADLTALGTRP